MSWVLLLFTLQRGLQRFSPCLQDGAACWSSTSALGSTSAFTFAEGTKVSSELVTLAHGGVTICQCRGERRKLKRFRPIDTLIKLSIFCQETELSLPFTLPATRRRWLKNFAGVTHGFSCVDDGLTLLAGCSPKDSLQSASVPLSPAFMIGGFVHFKV